MGPSARGNSNDTKKKAHIWIGPFDPPLEWMRTWTDRHENWEYCVYDNDFLVSRTFICQPQIIEYYRRGMYAGVSDLIRYEILYEKGGFIPEADSICVNPVDELFQEERCYTVYEYPEGKTGMVSPFLASNSGNQLIFDVLNKIKEIDPKTLNRPWHSVGNGFLKRFLRKYDHKEFLTIFPSHYFIPEHLPKKIFYEGTDKIYARQMWGSTTRSYPHSRGRHGLSEAEIDERRAIILDGLERNA